ALAPRPLGAAAGEGRAPPPPAAVEGAELVPVPGPARRAAVRVLDRGDVSAAPGLARVHQHVANGRAEPGAHRHGEPSPSLARLDPVAVLPAVLLVLHGVEEHEQ